MKKFRFSLQRILEFRKARLAEEERKLGLIQSEVAELDRQIEYVQRLRHSSAQAFVLAEEMRGQDLRALAGFKAKLSRDELALQEKKAASVRKLRHRQEAYQLARRDYRLLEKLRHRRFAQWLQATNRELDQLASDLYLARWKIGDGA